MRLVLGVAVVCVSTVLFVGAPVEAAAPTLENARSLIEAGSPEEAILALRELVEAEPGDAAAWSLLGGTLHRLERFDESVAAYERAVAAGAPAATTRYNQACAAARAGRTDGALTALEEAVRNGFRQIGLLETDVDLVSLHGHERFVSLVNEVETKARPCTFSADFRQFDFWIGTWDVLMPDGRKAGTNRIERAADGCLLIENWSSALGGSGKSLNFFDHRTGTWRQTWVDSSGRIIRYDGELVDGVMRFVGTVDELDGTRELSRMTIEPRPDGTVRQLIERSKDDGATWSVWFDGTYAHTAP